VTGQQNKFGVKYIMGIELIHIGFGNILAMNRVIAIASPNSAPIKRTIQEGRDKGLLIDMTSGRKTKAVIFTDSEHIVLAALAPETIAGRLTSSREGVFTHPEQLDETDESDKPVLIPS
jgi:extracellular matrix regulatory protein A